MPILARETDLYPSDLFSRVDDAPGQWWALYTMPRQEKQLLRRLKALDVPFYAPMCEKRAKSPAGRVRTSYVPLFPGYVFSFGSEEERYRALTTNSVSKVLDVPNQSELAEDLDRIRQLIETGAPMTPEAKLRPGKRVRILSGSLAGLEGTVVKRHKTRRLLVAVNFLQRGASVELDECQLEELT